MKRETSSVAMGLNPWTTVGPRFFDWQLAQSPEESWRECELHARNLLGEAGYCQLKDEIAGKKPAAQFAVHKAKAEDKASQKQAQAELFDA